MWRGLSNVKAPHDPRNHSNTPAVRAPARRMAAAVARLPILLQNRHCARGVGGDLGSIAGSRGTPGGGSRLEWLHRGRPGPPSWSSTLLAAPRPCLLAGST